MARLLIVSFACLLLSAGCIWALNYEPGVQDLEGREWGVVVSGPEGEETVLFGVPVGAGGLSARDRVTIIADQRLDVLSEQGVLDNPDNFQVGLINGQIAIYVNNPNGVGNLPPKTLIVTVDSNFSKFLRRNRWDIAYFWRDLMRKWSQSGNMKALDMTDPAGRPLNPKHTWHKIPAGYSSKAVK